MNKYMHVPRGIEYRPGAKVCWWTYRSLEEAEEAAKVARHNASIDAALGYDFGYQSPGSITPVEKGFEVCFS